MRKIVLMIIIAAAGFIVACDKHDTLPAYTAPTIFAASTSMSHLKDTISSKGDTIWLTASGTISDTSRTYAISATVKATDTTTALNLISGNYLKSVSVKFDTTGYGVSGLFKWTTVSKSLYITTPAIPAKTKIKTTCLFTFGLNLSSQTGNQTGTDPKFTYAQ